MASRSPAVRRSSPRSVPTSVPSYQQPVRRLLESVGLLLSGLLLFRAVGAEPYGVPTGSMAPTLAGNHRMVFCPRCSYPVLVGCQDEADDGTNSHVKDALCPNCGCAALDLNQTPVCRGDHLMVNKNVYEWRRPRRWEMAVFRCPANPSKSFVKRVIGLPGERVQVQDGDVFINQDIARKTLSECKAVRLPVFDNNYQPAPDGWCKRWQPRPDQGSTCCEGTRLLLNTVQHTSYQWLIYRHWLLDENKAFPIQDDYGYNGNALSRTPEAVHDFMVECDLEAENGDGWVALGITDGSDEWVVELPVGTCKEGTRLRNERVVHAEGVSSVYRTAPSFGLTTQRTYHIELAFVDRRLTLAIDGRCPLAPLDRPSVAHRPAVVQPVRFGARGVNIRLDNIRLFRDIHYTKTGRHGIQAPVRLGNSEYFVLGDNSPNSDDSRYWSDARGDPLPVQEESFLGKPFLVHLPSRIAYWNCFGTRWQYQSIDWSRIRWLH